MPVIDKWSRPKVIGTALSVVCAVAASLCLVLAGPASAQTAFGATAAGAVPLPVGCPGGAFFCTAADVSGYGPATWKFTVDSFTVNGGSCGITYVATVDFTLASDGSTLVLNEAGIICSPGENGISWYVQGPKSYGHPSSDSGSWSVDTLDSTGQFAGLAGSGTDALQTAGARVTASYTGTLG